MTQFAGKTILVTGASGGLGQAIIAGFEAQGGTVIAGDIGEPGALGMPRKLDVSDESSWIALLDEIEHDFGGLDVLVNNAGIYRPNIPFEEMPLDLWRQHFAVNSDGVFLGCKHAILRMKGRGGGAIVNMGSGMSIKANPTGAAYCGSKAAVLMTTRTAAGAAGKYNIRVNAVLPGAVPTTMLMGNMVAGQSEETFLAQMESYSVLGRLASPEDIAAAVVFLSSPAAGAISGVYLPVDGGNMPGA
jgi:NAD(P)-dependent dehydrogenase (short-subunit alcohol dehydrogenase family)